MSDQVAETATRLGQPEGDGARPEVGFRWFWGAFSVSTLGDQITWLALPLAAYARTGDPLVVGIAASMETVTSVLFSLIAGALADRWSHRRVLVVTDLARASLLLLLAMVVVNDQFPIGVLYFVAFGLGALRQLHDAAAGAALARVVPRSQLLRANSRLSASESIGNTAGPAVAGGLVAAGGLAFAFAADAASFVASALGTGRVRALRNEGDENRVREPLTAGGLTRSIGEGLRAVLGDRSVRLATLLVASMNVVTIAVEAQFVPYAREILHMGAAGVGAYFAVGGLAGVLASIVVSRGDGAIRGDVMLLAVSLVAVSVSIAGLWPSHVTAGIAFVGTGAGAMVAGIQLSAMRQHRFPVRLLGRVSMATRFALHGSLPLAFLAGGWFSRVAGPDALFTVSATVGAAGVLACWLAGLAQVRVDPG